MNDTDLLVERDPGVRTWGTWHLEPLWLVVVAAALSYLGRAELGFAGGQKITASNLDDLSRMSQVDLERLSFITTPAGVDAAGLTRVATLLGLPPALGQGEVTNEVAARFVAEADATHATASELKAYVQSAPRLWGEELFDDPAGRLARIAAFARRPRRRADPEQRRQAQATESRSSEARTPLPRERRSWPESMSFAGSTTSSARSCATWRTPGTFWARTTHTRKRRPTLGPSSVTC